MKYVCLGYLEEQKWDAMSKSEQDAFMAECFAYDDVLRKSGYFVGGEALQSVENAATLRYQNGKVTVTDGPYAETKEQLGGLFVLDGPWNVRYCCVPGEEAAFDGFLSAPVSHMNDWTSMKSTAP